MILMQTAKFKLKLDSTLQSNALNNMMEQYRQATNFVSQYIFDNDFILNSYKLDKTLYRQIRQLFGLKSQLAQSVTKTVTARYKATQTQLDSKPYRFQNEHGQWQRVWRDLNWLWQPIHFNRPQADLVRNRDYSFIDGGQRLSLNTLDKRIKVSYTTKGFNDYLDGTWKLGTAKLLKSGHNWFLHIAASKEVPDFNTDNVKHVVGIDRGLRFLATVYDEQGQTTFFDGKAILRKRHKYAQRRAELQARGTKSAKRRLKALSGRENRWMSDVNHQISKTLVKKYGAHTLFTIEDLTNVSFDRTNLHGQAANDIRSWTFFDLEQKLKYKANNNQSMVIQVSAAYTSQRCVKCGTINKGYRHHDTHEYHCQNCGYRSNDDRLGAMNIQQLGTQFVSGVEKPVYTKLTIAE